MYGPWQTPKVSKRKVPHLIGERLKAKNNDYEAEVDEADEVD